MVWFFRRNDEEMRVETRYDNDTSEFVVTVRSAGGMVESERFATLERCRARLVALEQRFETEQWTHSGPQMLLPNGFPKQRLRDGQ